jgi:hypothetical protein
MTEPAVKSATILEIADGQDLKWPAVQATIGAREAENTFDDSTEMKALKFALMVLHEAGQKP